MVKGIAVVNNTRGIHARPSSEIATAAQTFKSAITFNFNKKTANPVSVLQIIIMEMFKDSEVEIIAEGGDEQEAFNKMKELLEKEYEYD